MGDVTVILVAPDRVVVGCKLCAWWGTEDSKEKALTLGDRHQGIVHERKQL